MQGTGSLDPCKACGVFCALNLKVPNDPFFPDVCKEIHFQHVAPMYKGNYYLCVGPKWSDWQAVRITDLSVPQFKLRDETGKDFQLLAQSGFLWGGAAFSKQVQVAEGAEGAEGIVRKITPMLFA